VLTSQPRSDQELAELARRGSRYRRSAGVLIGAALGLVYGTVSQNINTWALPGLPYYQPPFSPLINMLLCCVGGGLLGLLSAWFKEAVVGIVVASLVSSAIMGGVMLSFVRLDAKSGAGIVLAILFMLLPIFGLVVPTTWALRWAVGKQEESYLSGYFIASRVWGPLLLAVVVGGLAATALYPPEARPVLATMNALVQAGLAAPDQASRPPSLQSDTVGNWQQGARGDYTLEWTFRDLQRFAIPHPAANEREYSVVIARFESGYALACLFLKTSDTAPTCAEWAKR